MATTAYKSQSMEADAPWFSQDLLARFRNYTAIHTTSDVHSASCPSTQGQWDLARVLVAELKQLGLESVELSEFCYVTALLPSNLVAGSGVKGVDPVAFIAHMDTSPDCEGKGVKVLVHSDYDGKPIALPAGVFVDPVQSPELAKQTGKTILTSDGSTLLGADDKAGISEIMSALRYLIAHPDLKHGDVEVIFTPDEEIGRGVDRLPRQRVKSRVCFTFDGDTEGSYNVECFNGWTIDVGFRGKMIHPGDARGRMVNPVAMAGLFIASIPRNESPEATDGIYGFYCPQEISGNMEAANFTVFIRDFDSGEIQRRIEFLQQLGRMVEAAFPGGVVTVKERKQYLNMREELDKQPEIRAKLEQAIRDTGIEPFAARIRGGTDGSRLTELGMPTPNIFAGGHNFHSVVEWVSLESMVRASKVMINLVQLWAAA